ncbi:MAG TPA: phenylacetate--CoA ligase family protein [Blastocatellia bacterium]|nr:phenylacetate--CoA ligase family protein [Blastocatellia bacterium]
MANFAGAKGLIKTILKPIYYRLPVSICYGPSFSNTLKLLTESQTWSEERLVDYQIAKLKVMLRHCAANVPYYRCLFRDVGFDPKDFRTLSELSALPLLEKGSIQSNPSDFLAENIKSSQRHYFTTGGTMGKPLGLFNMRDSGGRERAFIHAQWARVGFQLNDRRAMLRGWAVRNRRHWTYEASERAYVFSNFHMTPENVAEYARVIRRERLPYLHSYPSAVIDFSRRLRDLGLDPPPFRAVLAASENLYPGQREFIESYFGARLFSWYGHTENVVLAGECEVSNHYHVFPEYGVTEVVKEDGSAADKEGELGELVGSSLDNFAMPLIRYRTEDWAVIGPPGCTCGRNYKLLKETRGRRLQEMMVGKLDNLISVTALNVHSDVFDNVRQFQFYQREKGKVQLRIIRKPEYSERDSSRILAALNEKIGDTLELSLTFPDEIPLMPRGKFRFVIRELPLPRAFVNGGGVEASS